VTFVLLARGLKSILLPAKAVLLNALSVTASYGILVLVFQHGLGMQALWGTRSYGAVDSFAPVLIFGFLFGVSMDYEVRDVVANTPAHRLDIDLDTAPVVDTLGNPDHLQRLFRNIIDNAVRYAHRRVHITATTTVDSVQVEIDDDGPGIPPADRQRVFDRFVRLDSSRERNTGTTGLGLAIAHEIALTHHATSPSSTIQPGAPGSSSSSRTLPAAHRSQPIPSPARSLRNHPNGAPIRATRRRRRAGIMLVADVGFIGTRGCTELRPRQGVTSHWVTLSVRIT
jgi:hypothetical protein